MLAMLAIEVRSGSAPAGEVLLRALAAIAEAKPKERIDDAVYELDVTSKVKFEEMHEALLHVAQDFPGQLVYGLVGAFGPGAIRGVFDS